MIPPRLAAILWLKSRLSLNQLKRRTPLGGVVTVLILVASILTAIAAFVVPLVVGVNLLSEARPGDLLFAWDVAVVVFLFFWVIGVVTELQRSESLSLDKLLHLPISLRAAFLLNYAGSWLTFSLVVFVPAMLAFALALVIVHGPRMLIVLPLVVTFLLMVTALTFQFRGWLAALMINKRWRGTIIATVTVAFIGLMQLPQVFFWTRADPHMAGAERSQELQRQRDAGEIDVRDYNAAMDAMIAEMRIAEEQKDQRMMDRLLTINMILPPGWLPYGTQAAARGQVVPGALGTLGAFAIAGLSLTMSYRTTMRLYTRGGRGRRRGARKAANRRRPGDVKRARVALVECALPWCSDRVAAIAFASFRSLIRSPQAKLLLLTPVILLVLFGSSLVVGRGHAPPEQLRPLMAVGTIALAMFCLVQLLQNMFGFDRDGFRGLVLSPVPRHEILFGKNLAVAPLALAIGGIGLAAVQFAFPLRLSHLLASILQLASVYMICCMVGNVISIVAPMAMSNTTLKAAEPTMSTVLKQMGFAFLFPVAMLPTLIPLGLELGLDMLGWRSGIPVYLALSVVEVLVVAWIYGRVLRLEGRFLQNRERRILDEVTRQAA